MKSQIVKNFQQQWKEIQLEFLAKKEHQQPFDISIKMVNLAYQIELSSKTLEDDLEDNKEALNNLHAQLMAQLDAIIHTLSKKFNDYPQNLINNFNEAEKNNSNDLRAILPNGVMKKSGMAHSLELEKNSIKTHKRSFKNLIGIIDKNLGSGYLSSSTKDQVNKLVQTQINHLNELAAHIELLQIRQKVYTLVSSAKDEANALSTEENLLSTHYKSLSHKISKLKEYFAPLSKELEAHIISIEAYIKEKLPLQKSDFNSQSSNDKQVIGMDSQPTAIALIPRNTSQGSQEPPFTIVYRSQTFQLTTFGGPKADGTIPSILRKRKEPPTTVEQPKKMRSQGSTQSTQIDEDMEDILAALREDSSDETSQASSTYSPGRTI